MSTYQKFLREEVMGVCRDWGIFVGEAWVIEEEEGCWLNEEREILSFLGHLLLVFFVN